MRVTQSDTRFSEEVQNLSSGRVLELIFRHEAITAQLEGLSRPRDPRLRGSYLEDDLHDTDEPQALPRSRTFASIEEYSREVRERDKRAALRRESRELVQALAAEGMPEDNWVGIGDDEYALVEHEGAEPKLRRAPGLAIRLAPDWASPSAIEANAAAIMHSRHRDTVRRLSGVSALVGVGAGYLLFNPVPLLGVILFMSSALLLQWYLDNACPAANKSWVVSGRPWIIDRLLPPSAEGVIAAYEAASECRELDEDANDPGSMHPDRERKIPTGRPPGPAR